MTTGAGVAYPDELPVFEVIDEGRSPCLGCLGSHVEAYIDGRGRMWMAPGSCTEYAPERIPFMAQKAKPLTAAARAMLELVTR